VSLLERVQSPKDLRALAEDDLPALCAELREEIISICGRVGGHLGASLGAVELVVGLHRVFHAPEDDLVFDVGHQAYAHKLLTGRAPRMSTLRQEEASLRSSTHGRARSTRSPPGTPARR
jgi:1-deoxy-D-xylulose-5-phosphate synthase